VDDNFPSPALSAAASSTRHRRGDDSDDDIPIPDYMISSFISTTSSRRDTGLGGSGDAEVSSAEEEEDLKNPELETTMTFVGNVKDRPVFIVDDMIDQAGSWIAAAETVVKKGGATKVYCMATHGLFGDACLEELEQCDCIERIIVTNTFPIPPEKAAKTKKLFVISVDNLLAEAIRRNHHGESISQLFLHYD
jgi:ribose-phosphate pyrophosphokinase